MYAFYTLQLFAGLFRVEAIIHDRITLLYYSGIRIDIRLRLLTRVY